jgi:hypothetical protein
VSRLRHPGVWRVLPIVLVLAAGVAVGWLVGGGEKRAEAAEPVQFTPAASVDANAFTPPADIDSLVTVKAAKGPFGGSGSNFVCDRERLISFLDERPDHLRAWARVEAIQPTAARVAAYIRALRPATLIEPTRVTTHTFQRGRAVASQAILAAGTAVLVDEQGAIRVRCRTGAPLLDPVLASDERCQACPANYRPSRSVQVAEAYYAVHPAPPPVRGEKHPPRPPTKPVTVQVVKRLPPEYVVRRVEGGRTRTATVERTRTRTVRLTRTRTVRGRTRTVTVRLPAQTRTVTRTVTVQGPAPPPQRVTEVRTITVYEGSG